MGRLVKKVKAFIKKPYSILLHWNNKGYFKQLSDQTTLKLMWYGAFGKKLNLKNPQTFNEKLQWLKLYDRKPVYTTMVDKYDAKKYVADIIGKEYVIPNLGVWDHFDDIDFDSLPNQFVLKTTHDSGGVFICKDKSTMDFNKAKNLLEDRLSKSYYIRNREWPYKDVKPRIIAEKYIKEDSKTNGLVDYKFYCFNGEPKFLLYIFSENAVDGQKRDMRTIFDLNFCKTEFQRPDHAQLSFTPEKPVNFDKMIELSKMISKNMPFLRVDWYEVEGKLYLGELTFYPVAGYGNFYPEKYNTEIGSWIDLPIENEENRV